jgi:multidrug resistance efflux pump
MTSKHPLQLIALAALLLLALVVLPACISKEETEARGVVIVNAPVAGEVRHILVNEGMRLKEGDPVVEIVVRNEAAPAATPRGEDPVAAAGKNITSAQAEIESARAEVVRAEVEVQRLTPLVASGQATQGELDGAQSTYDRAQQRLQKAQAAERDAQAGLVAARQPSRVPTPLATPSERVVYAVASSAGIVSVIGVRTGERVTVGQPLATLRAEQ